MSILSLLVVGDPYSVQPVVIFLKRSSYNTKKMIKMFVIQFMYPYTNTDWSYKFIPVKGEGTANTSNDEPVHYIDTYPIGR